MATFSVIRRWALREQLSIREIARRSGLSRSTIKKYLAAGVVEPRYAKRMGTSKLDPIAEKQSQWLKVEQSKNRKQQRALLQMHADLVALGVDGSYGRVAAFARAWRQRQHEAEKSAGRGTFVPLVFSPGEDFRFDWSEDWAFIGGERVKLQVAHTNLSHSRAFHLRAYPLQTHEMLFDAHNHAFRVLGGVPRRGIQDDMKTAVDRVGVGKARDINQRFAVMASHYLFEPEFCNPACAKPGVDREMVEILALVLHHDEQAVLTAVELVLEAGVPTKTHVLNVLHRFLDGTPQAAPVEAPQALKLSKEPLANVLRYDAMRTARKAQAQGASADHRDVCHAS